MDIVRVGRKKSLMEDAELDAALAALDKESPFPPLADWETFDGRVKIRHRGYYCGFDKFKNGNDLLLVLKHASGKSEATLLRGYFGDTRRKEEREAEGIPS